MVERIPGTHAERGGWCSLFVGSNALRSIVLAGAVALHGLFMFITNTVLPSIVAEIGGAAWYAWAATAFSVGSIAGAMLTPTILKCLASRRAYELGLGLFLTGSALCAVAPDLGTVIVGRAFQGLAGGLLSAIATSMIPVMFPEGLRPRAVALVASVWGPLALVGPFVGGIFAELGQWRGAFCLALPLVAAIGVLARRVLPQEAPPYDGFAAVLSSGQMLRLALIAGSVLVVSVASVPGTMETAMVGVGLAALCFGGGLLLDRRADRRVLLEGAFGFASVVGNCSTTMILIVLAVGAGSFIPYVLSFALGAPPIVGGYVAALSSLAWSLAALLSAGIRPTVSRRIMAIAPLTVALALVGVGWFIWTGSIVGIAIAWTAFGASVGAAWPHLASRLIDHAPLDEHASAGGFVTTVQILAGTFGAALAGLVANVAGISNSTVPADVAYGGLLLFVSFAVPPLIALLATRRLLALTRSEAAEMLSLHE